MEEQDWLGWVLMQFSAIVTTQIEFIYRLRSPMTPDALFQILTPLADAVIADPQWSEQGDELGLSVFGMILYGYGLAVGRLAMLLDMAEIDAAVERCLCERLAVPVPWAQGLVAEAGRSALDPSYHPGQAQLIDVGYDYLRERDLSVLVENVLANIGSVRRRAS